MKKLFFNADVVTVDEKNMQAEAVYVENGKIVAVGTNVELEKYKKDDVELVDLGGKTLMPAFIDPHSHFGATCQMSVFPNVASSPNGPVGSIDDMIEVLKKAAETIDPSKPIVGVGYDNYLLKENRHPNKFDLNKVSTTRPVIVVHASMHIAAMNQVALDTIYEYTAETKDPEGGVIGRVEGTTEPNGYVEETAMLSSFLKILGDADPESIKAKLLAGQKQYASKGIATVQDGMTSDDFMKMFMFGHDNGLLYLDVHAYPPAGAKSDAVDGKFPVKVNEKLGRVKFSGLKFILDGSIQGRTGWLVDPYLVVEPTDDPTYCAYPRFKDEDVINAIEQAHKLNTQILIHCNGDAAAAQMIRCYKIASKNVPPKADSRPVMIHAQMTTDENLGEMKELEIIPAFFGSHPFYWGDAHIMNLGEKRAFKMDNTVKAVALGMKPTAHDDTPVVPANPLFNMWVMTNRLTRSNKVLGPDCKVPVFQALKSCTINCANQYFEEDIKGSIEVGKLADFVITDKNVLKVDTMEIKNIEVLETIKEGNTIYKK